MTIDGTDVPIYDPAPYPHSKKWWSHKFKSSGFRYEVAVCIQTGDIVWINGPFPCGRWPDINIFRRNLIHMLLPGKMVEADEGCRGERRRVRTTKHYASWADYYAKKAARARHETCNKRLKQWKILKQVHRHDRDKHASVFAAVAVCTQISLENGEPLYEVTY